MGIYNQVRRILAWVCVFAFLGCSESKKITKSILTLDKHPDVAAQYCSNKFPMKDTVIYRDSIKLDTLYETLPADTVYCNDTVIIRTSPTIKIITKIITKYKEVIKQPTEKIEEQRALLQSCEGRYTTMVTKYETADLERKQWKERFWWLLIVVAALAGYIVRKPVMKLVSKLPIG